MNYLKWVMLGEFLKDVNELVINAFNSKYF